MLSNVIKIEFSGCFLNLIYTKSFKSSILDRKKGCFRAMPNLLAIPRKTSLMRKHALVILGFEKEATNQYLLEAERINNALLRFRERFRNNIRFSQELFGL